MNGAPRQRKRSRRGIRRLAQGESRRSRYPARRGSHPAADDDLDDLLIDRGWILVERGGFGDVYDWPASAADPSQEVTYLLVQADGSWFGLPPYRVRLVNGERETYDDADRLVADLDRIEGHSFGR
jgi:hypothetical protein